VIQVEPSLSRTASGAWRWVAIRRGGEAALAAGLARVLLEERLVAAQSPTPMATRAEAAELAGIGVEALFELARTIVERTPAVVIAHGDDPAVAALNVVLGAVGARGGIVRRAGRPEMRIPAAGGRSGAGPAQDGPAQQELAPAPRAVLIDATAPWDFKPPVGGEVFRFAAWDGGDSNADWLLPAPGFLEEMTDAPTTPGSAVETYAIAAKLLTPPHEVHSGAEFLAMCDPSVPAVEAAILARCEAISTSREELLAGAVWTGPPPEPGGLRCELQEWPEPLPSGRSHEWTDAWTPAVLPPLASKLYAESRLRERPSRRIA
jgi:hypothetical protein